MTTTQLRMVPAKRLRRGAGLFVAALLAAVALVYRPDLAIRVATGVVAHDICSKTFTSGFEPAAVMAETITRPGIRRIAWLLNENVNTAEKTVTASFAGVLDSRAVYRNGLGCVIVRNSAGSKPIEIDVAALKRARGSASLPAMAPPAVVEPENQKLAAALDNAFAEPPSPPLRRTKAIIIVHAGKIIAERYAAGIGPNTPLLGFSLTKTVVNAMLGILVQQGRLKTSDPAPIAEWRDAADPRHAITIEHLMRMTSGLDLDETNSGFDASSRILYLDDDMATAAAKAKLIAAPGTRFFYSSPSTVLLGRVIREKLGGKPEHVLEFAWRELFNPLGMDNVTLEFDPTGNFMAGSYMFATARDWARLGLLYLGDGMVGDRRLLPEGWVDDSARATLGLYYGAGLWTTRSDHPWARQWVKMGFPPDAFFGSGSLGQRIVVLPTQRLVIVRLGDAVDPNADMPGLARLVRETVAAVGP